MAWRLKGTYAAPCSCYLACPCTFGELDGDRGWCSGVVFYDITEGDVNGVDVGGTRAALVADWPRGFLAGDGTARAYFDPSVSDEQRAALEPVVTGQAGGSLEGLSALIPTYLESKMEPIEFGRSSDGSLQLKIGVVADLNVEPLRNEAGDITTVANAAAGTCR
jgi:hypothetical protein